MFTFNYDADHRRAGGCLLDAALRLATTPPPMAYRPLRNAYTVDEAWEALGLKDELNFQLDEGGFTPSAINWTATAGPVLAAGGILWKEGLSPVLISTCLSIVEKLRVSDGRLAGGMLFTSRIGYRTKLLEKEEVISRLKEGKPHARAIFMVDALEQFISNPIMEVLNNYVFVKRLEKGCPFKNKIVRASADWKVLGERIDQYPVALTGDWSSFDLQRNGDDLMFVLEVFVKRFSTDTDIKRSFTNFLLNSYRNSFIKHSLVVGDDTVIEYEGGVPSGCSFTSLADTALNALYLRYAIVASGISAETCEFWCNGDDFVVLTHIEDDTLLRNVEKILNDTFTGGITEFTIHKGRKKAVWVQATFPPGTDLSKGTRHLLGEAFWREVDSSLEIDDEKGLSHRIHLDIKGAVKFNGYYWGPEDVSVRDTHAVLLRLMHPEGIDKSVGDYLRRCLSFAGDNCFNDNVINKIVFRVYGGLKILSMEAQGINADLMLKLACFNYEEGELYPFGDVFWFRRVPEKVELMDDPVYVLAHTITMRYVSVLIKHSMSPPHGEAADYLIRDMINRGARWVAGRVGSPTFEVIKESLSSCLRTLGVGELLHRKHKLKPLIGDELRALQTKAARLLDTYIFVWNPRDASEVQRWLENMRTTGF